MTTYDNFTELRVLVQNVSLSRQTRRRNENNKKKCFTSSSPSTLNHQSILVRVFESFVAIREAALVKFTHSSDQHRSEAITSSRWKVFCRKSERAKSEIEIKISGFRMEPDELHFTSTTFQDR